MGVIGQLKDCYCKLAKRVDTLETQDVFGSWCGFGAINGDGSVASSAGVQSVTQVSTGVYEVTLANAMPSTNFAVLATVEHTDSRDSIDIHYLVTSPTTIEFTVHEGDNGTAANVLVDRAFTFGIPCGDAGGVPCDCPEGLTVEEVQALIDASVIPDDQQLGLAGNVLTLEDGGTVDLTPFLDDTDTDDQIITAFTLSPAGVLTLTIQDGNTVTVDLSALDTDTDDQTLSLAGTLLTIADGNTVDLSSIDTDDQTLSTTANADGSTASITISEGNTIPILHPAIPALNTIDVDRTFSYRAPVTETDMHDDADVIMDLGAPTTAEAGWSQGPAVNAVTLAAPADRVEGTVNIVAPDAGASNYWSRPYIIVQKNNANIAWIDAGSVMQTNGTYSGRAVFTGSFTDDNPAAGDVYTYVLFNEDARTATLPASSESHISLTATERVTVYAP